MSDPLFDLSNPIVRLCVAGTQAEYGGRIEEAKRFYRKAWEERQSDLDSCIAAHYIARHQSKPEDTLRWNLTALEHAKAVASEDLRNFYPSLYLNLAKSYEDVGDSIEARGYYELSAASAALSGEGYSEMVKISVEEGLKRLGASRLIDSFLPPSAD